jgi:hypothetical protein
MLTHAAGPSNEVDTEGDGLLATMSRCRSSSRLAYRLKCPGISVLIKSDLKVPKVIAIISVKGRAKRFGGLLVAFPRNAIWDLGAPHRWYESP